MTRKRRTKNAQTVQESQEAAPSPSEAERKLPDGPAVQLPELQVPPDDGAASAEPAPEPPEFGRRPLLKERGTRDSLLALLRANMSIVDACASLGISERSYHRWRELGEQAEARKVWNVYRRFLQATREARATYKEIVLTSIATGVQENPQLALEVAGRLWPKEWSAQVKHTIATELDDAVARIEAAFAGDPVGLRKALSALAGVDSSPPAGAAGRAGAGGPAGAAEREAEPE